MLDLANNVFFTNLVTILVGVVIFVIGQAVLKFVLEPMFEQRRVIGEVVNSVIFYAHVYANPGGSSKKAMDEAHQNLRHNSSELRASTHVIPSYALWESLGIVRKHADILEVGKELIALSWGVYPKNDPLKNVDARDRVFEILDVKTE